MMKFTPAMTVGLAALFVVPIVGAQEKDGEGGLRAAIADTAQVLRELAGLSEALERGEVEAIDPLLAYSEPAILDAPGRDQLLAGLREEVSAMQMQVDAAQAPHPLAKPWTGGSSPGTGPLNLRIVGPQAPPGPLTQTSDSEPAVEAQGVTPAETPRGDKRRLEGSGFTADALRHARLLILAERPGEALEILDRAPAGIEVTYWRARCLEELGSLDEAISAYREVAAHPGAAGSTADSAGDPGSDSFGVLAQRALQDVEFLEWKRDFESRRASRKEGEQQP